MAIFAISDLHLSFGSEKPMDIFGESWENHTDRLDAQWRAIVGQDDTVLIPGDISWAMGFPGALPDFAFIESLPGRKILSKGNHDYWWSTKSKFDAFLKENGFTTISMLHNNAYRLESYTLCGSRGWLSPDDPAFTKEDEKVFNREMERLRLSLSEGRKLGGELLAMLHYPPFDMKHRPNGFAELLKEFEVRICLYGHMHGRLNPGYKEEIQGGIRYHLISADYLMFEPLRVE